MHLSYDVTVILWITRVIKNRMTTHVMTFCRVHITSLNTSLSIMGFLIDIGQFLGNKIPL